MHWLTIESNKVVSFCHIKGKYNPSDLLSEHIFYCIRFSIYEATYLVDMAWWWWTQG